MSCDHNANADSSVVDLKSFVTVITTLLILFFIGLYLQIKIIRVSIENKGVNWKVDIQHSIIMIGLFSFRISFEIVSYLIPALHQYTGKWFCYLTLFINQLGMVSVLSHSLIIAIYKYIYVVKANTIDFNSECCAKMTLPNCVSCKSKVLAPISWSGCGALTGPGPNLIPGCIFSEHVKATMCTFLPANFWTEVWPAGREFVSRY